MKQNFGSFVKKESLHILRDKRTMLVVMMIPVVLMVLFGFAIGVIAGAMLVRIADAWYENH